MSLLSRFPLFLLFIFSTPQLYSLKTYQDSSRLEKIHILTGLDNLLQNYRNLLENKKIGIVTNHTGVDRNGIPVWERIDEVEGANVLALFSPEHGLFGEAAAGERVTILKHYSLVLRGKPEDEGKDEHRYYSLYGDMIKPTPESLQGINLLIYDIQDIGARTYTYISTLGLVLEAAGEANIPVMVLDRPDPITGTRIDGPLLKPDYRSFVGFYPIPIQYGMTPGELARMIIEEEWIESKPKLDIIPLISWYRGLWYDDTDLPWIKPSPNIPDLTTAIVYPGMVLVEATNVSEGRGTDHPFLWIGAPWINENRLCQQMNKMKLPGVQFESIQFKPQHLPGIANHPKYEGEKCQGIEIILTDQNLFQSVRTGITLLVILKKLYPDRVEIKNEQLNRLMGSDLLSRGLTNDWSPATIISKYKKDIEIFRQKRQSYLLY